jgi:hypothetical protein
LYPATANSASLRTVSEDSWGTNCEKNSIKVRFDPDGADARQAAANLTAEQASSNHRLSTTRNAREHRTTFFCEGHQRCFDKPLRRMATGRDVWICCPASASNPLPLSIRHEEGQRISMVRHSPYSRTCACAQTPGVFKADTQPTTSWDSACPSRLRIRISLIPEPPIQPSIRRSPEFRWLKLFPKEQKLLEPFLSIERASTFNRLTKAQQNDRPIQIRRFYEALIAKV